MSSSDTGDRVHLTAQAPNEAVEVFVIDGSFQRIRKGVGRLETDLAPGLYKVKFKAGPVTDEQLVSLESDRKPVHVTARNLATRSVVPVDPRRAATGLMRAAHELSSRRPVQAAGATGLMVFVCDPTRRGRRPLLDGLSLLDPLGQPVDTFETAQVEGSAGERWAGVCLSLNPGSYRLRLETGTAGPLERVVVVSEGWQTQIIAGRRSYGGGRTARLADLLDAALVMVSERQAYDGWLAQLSAAEAARLALTSGRPLLNEPMIAEARQTGLPNPAALILAAHTHLAADKPDPKLVEAACESIPTELQVHPDVRALRLWCGETVRSFGDPPMLRSSWSAVVAASRSKAFFVPESSLSARVGLAAWREGAWLVWRPEADDRRLCSRFLDQVVPEGTSAEQGAWPLVPLHRRVRPYRPSPLGSLLDVQAAAFERAYASQPVPSSRSRFGEAAEAAVEACQIPMGSVMLLLRELERRETEQT